MMTETTALPRTATPAWDDSAVQSTAPPASLLFVDCGNAITDEIAAHFAATQRQHAEIAAASELLSTGPSCIRQLTAVDSQPEDRSRPKDGVAGTVAVLVAPFPFSESAVAMMRDAVNVLIRRRLSGVLLVHSIASCFGDQAALQVEDDLQNCCTRHALPLRVLRTGFVTGADARLRWRRLAGLRPLVSPSWCSTFVTVPEIVTEIQRVASHPDLRPGPSTTLLGRNRPWRDVLQECRSGTIGERLVGGACTLLRFLGVRLAGSVAAALWRRGRSGRRVFNFDTIRPRSQQELLSLCSAANSEYVVICGYNNGIQHFGWQFPGKTAVPTTDSGERIHIERDSVVVDAGLTLKQCADALQQAGKQFPVMPNFSYIGVGTAFFVPIHGSGSAISTLGDAIEWVRLFDRRAQHFVEASRGEPLFDQAMYDRDRDVVLLELRFQIEDKTAYEVRTETIANPSAAEVWEVFSDRGASNIEVRKNRGSSDAIEVSRYYTVTADSAGQLAAPQDSIGRIWDRIEETPVAAFLFHWFVRTFGYHVELFLRRDEFEVFWRHHRHLDLSKIQLRFVHRDGMPHSPFGDADCVSADLFMSRRRREAFQEFLKTHLPAVRNNPGKQSLQV